MPQSARISLRAVFLSLVQVSSLLSGQGMFQGAESFNSDVSQWQVGNLLVMRYMFYSASSFNQSLCAWDDRLPLSTQFDNSFSLTACESQLDPSRTNGGPYCAICPQNPTESPTKSPTKNPTRSPSPSPTRSSTRSPTKNPTMSPTGNPTKTPTKNPTMSPSPFKKFTTTAELRSAALAADSSKTNCNAPVYQTYGPMDAWDVSLLNNLDGVFANRDGPFCNSGGPYNLSRWDVSQVTSMVGMLHPSVVFACSP